MSRGGPFSDAGAYPTSSLVNLKAELVEKLHVMSADPVVSFGEVQALYRQLEQVTGELRARERSADGAAEREGLFVARGPR